MYFLNTCTVEWGELGYWCGLGQTLVNSHLCDCSVRDTGVNWDRNLVHALSFLPWLVNAFLAIIPKVMIH